LAVDHIDHADRTAAVRHDHVHGAIRTRRALVHVVDSVRNDGEAQSASCECADDVFVRDPATCVVRIDHMFLEMLGDHCRELRHRAGRPIQRNQGDDDRRSGGDSEGGETATAVTRAMTELGGLREQDAIRQIDRHRHAERALDARFELFRARMGSRAEAACRTMRRKVHMGAGRFAAEATTEFKAVHSSLTSAAWSSRPSCPFSFWRARNSWVMTAASPRPSCTAISAQEKPPRTCNTSGSRYFGSSWAMARIKVV